ncbi:MAG TPA: efflux RND transporter periplasmic adaptor subunit [Syntrophorhabdales bacterium]|nr:efflux RND transporter periplasmic adaptor subunit [Syntrophorhabdales bacterium]
MKRKSLMIIGGAVVIAVLMIYLSKTGFLGSTTRVSRPAEAQAPAQSAQKEPQGSMPGMAGVPAAEEKKAEEAPTIEIPSEKQQLIGVKIATVSVQPLEKVIRTVGTVEYDQRKLYTVNTKVEGWIEKLYVNYTGIQVKRGEPLAEVYSPELWATQQEFINVVRWEKRAQAKNGTAQAETESGFGAMISKDAEALVGAARQRLKLWDISDEQIKKIEESEKPIRTLTIYSPVSGYVLQKTAVQGMKVMAGEKLFDIADLSSIWITADIYEYELPLLKVGDPATIQLSYFPGRQFSSKIDYIYPTLTGETRTAKARFVIPNPGMQLKPQMFTNVEFQVSLGRKLAVPEDAVLDTGLRQIVYVDKGNGYFEPREVRVGVRAEKMVEVTAGLKAGDKVASAANFLIDSEAKLKGVEPLPMKEQGQAARVKGQETATPPAHQH